MKFLLATNSKGKLAEYRRLAEGSGLEFTTAADEGITAPDPEETGSTFAENAQIKARAFMEASGMPVLADDSGLCVDALDGRPGIHSARYHGDHDAETAIDCLLEELDGVPMEKRTAHFVCHICCMWPDGRMVDVDGTCSGFIGFDAQGDGGFGFDPVFILADGRCFGVISEKEKDVESHRGHAVQALIKRLAGDNV